MSRPLRLTVEPQYALLEWARARCGVTASTWPPGSEAVGVMDGDTLRAVMVVNAVCGGACKVHFASDHTRRWATRNILGGLYGYVFLVKRLTRVQLDIPASRRPALVAAIKMGFRFEGVSRAAAVSGEDTITMAMLAGECPWITGKEQDDG